MSTRFVLAILATIVIAGCKSASPVVGHWGIEQDGAGFGEGADKTEMHIYDNSKFELSIGSVTLASGTWTFEDNKLVLSASTGKMGTDYRLENGKLIPNVQGTEATFWRFVRQ